MLNLGEFDASAIVDFKFTSRDTTGAPTTLSGTPAVLVYKSNSTTESASTGITLTVDFDSRTGLNHVRIDTSANTSFFASANDFDVVITAGTVDGTSVVGETIAHFSIRNRAGLKPAVAGRTLDVDGSGYINVQPASQAAIAAEVRSELTTELAYLDVAISSRMASGEQVTLAATQTFDNTGSWTGPINGPVESVSGDVGGNVVGNVGGVAAPVVLTTDYDAAKTAIQAGDQVDLVNAPNATAITAIQSGLSKPGTAQTITPADTAAAQALQTLAAGANGFAAIKTDTAANKITLDLLATGWTVVGGVVVFKTATLANAPGGGGGGTILGAYDITILVLDDDTEDPLSAALVAVRQGADVAGPLQTDEDGEVSMGRDAGNYVVTVTKGGYTGTPVTITVDADNTEFEIRLTANTIPIPTDPADCTVAFVARRRGVLMAGAVFSFTCTTPPTGDGLAFVNETRTATADANGLVTIALPQESVWNVGTAHSDANVSITVPAASTYQPPNFNI